jgi:hypothetical protein
MENQALSRPATKEEFEQFMAIAEPRLRVALVAAYGPDRGREAAAEALAYAWEHWERLALSRTSRATSTGSANPSPAPGVLVHGFGWTLREVAEVAGLRVTSVQNHLERGIAKLRSALEVSGARSS